MKTNIDLKIDYAFKKVFGTEQNKDLLISLLNSIAFKDKNEKIEDITILNPFNEKDFEGDKLSVVDIKATDNYGNLYDIEVQILFEEYYTKRILYYACRLYSTQLNEGTGYNTLTPVISISFINSIIFKETERYWNRFILKNQDNDLVLNEDIVFHIIELPKFNLSIKELREEIERWLYLIKYSKEMDTDNWPLELSEREYEKVMKELTKMFKIDKDREEYEAREKYVRDIATLRAVGEAKGRAEGLAEGRAEGKKELTFTIVKKMISEGYKYEEIAKITGLSLKEIETLYK